MTYWVGDGAWGLKVRGATGQWCRGLVVSCLDMPRYVWYMFAHVRKCATHFGVLYYQHVSRFVLQTSISFIANMYLVINRSYK